MKDTRRHAPKTAEAPLRIAVLVSRYHEEISQKLLSGAKSALERISAGVPEIFWVPGAYELPQAAQAAAETGRFHAIVALGCIVRGETPHFDFIARSVAQGLDAVGRGTGVAVSFGVLTVDSMDQARERAGGKWGNKGEEAALAAVDLALLQRNWTQHGKPTKSAGTSSPDSLLDRSGRHAD